MEVAKGHAADKLDMTPGYRATVQHRYNSIYVHQAVTGDQQDVSLDLDHAVHAQHANTVHIVAQTLVFADHAVELV
jgi:hypothetical protein